MYVFVTKKHPGFIHYQKYPHWYHRKYPFERNKNQPREWDTKKFSKKKENKHFP